MHTLKPALWKVESEYGYVQHETPKSATYVRAKLTDSQPREMTDGSSPLKDALSNSTKLSDYNSIMASIFSGVKGGNVNWYLKLSINCKAEVPPLDTKPEDLNT